MNWLIGITMLIVGALLALLLLGEDKLVARAEACQEKGAHLVRAYGEGHVCLRAEVVK